MTKIILLSVFVSVLIFSHIPAAAGNYASIEERDAVVDNAIGGMREGSRITGPDKYGTKTNVPKVPGTQLSPGMDTHAIAGASAAGSSQAAGFSRGGANEGIASGTGQETGAGGTAGSGGSLVDVEANVDLDSGTIDAGVGLDTDNTDQILDADVSAGGSETDITGSTDIAAGDLTADSALPSEITESAISSETDIGTEVDTSGGAVGNEADIGVEADVEGGTESDMVSDPADGLPVI